jgi:tetrapyrrole methylase family protein / MazG family protein
MPSVTVVGIGPGPVSSLTKEVEAELLRANKVFFRTGAHPVYEWLRGLGKHLVCFDLLYTTPWPDPEDMYDFMVSALLKEAALHGEALFAVPGNPGLLEDTTNLLRLKGPKEGVEIRVLPGVSFLDQILAEMNFDFSLGLQIVLPLTHLQPGFFTNRLALLVCQIEAASLPQDRPRVDLTMKFLLQAYPPDHSVTLIWTDGLPAYKTQSKSIALKDLAREYGEGKFFASLYVPPIA